MSPLYAASVPVFRHYLARADALVEKVEDEAILAERLAPDMFTAAEQFATAAGFALRTSFALAGLEVPAFADLGRDRTGLHARIGFADDRLAHLAEDAFAGAESRRIRHRAGFAELDQSAGDFLHLFGMPNFLFHLSMAFAILRRSGVEIGKADFDGQHDYPQGFRF